MIPGQNLLKMAFSVIAKTTVSYFKFAGRSLNDVGQDITTYDPPFDITGSVQEVQRDMYDKFGLDLQNSYIMFYTETNVLDVGRDVSGDQLEWNGGRYQCESDTEWHPIDGWDSVLCVRIGDAGGAP